MEVKNENMLAVDHPERKRFTNLLDWMRNGGSKYDKLKLRFYSDNHRGVHAKCDIIGGQTILFVPLAQIITLEKAF